MKPIDEKIRKRAEKLLGPAVEILGRVVAGERPIGFCRIRANQVVSAAKFLAVLAAGAVPGLEKLDVIRLLRLRDLLEWDADGELEPEDVLDDDLIVVFERELPELLPVVRALRLDEQQYLDMNDAAFDKLVIGLNVLGDRLPQDNSVQAWLSLSRADRIEMLIAAARDLAGTDHAQQTGAA